MAINLVDMAKGYLGRAVMEKIAGSLGGSTQQTESAIGAAIPSILGGLISKAGTQEGAEALSVELDKQDGGFLDNIGDAISGDGLGKLAGAGSGILGSLLGDSKLGSVLDIVGKVSGMGRSGSGSIIGLVGSLLMGMLGKQRESQGLDIGGLMGLLSSQKEHVAPALPEGMGAALGLGDLSGWGASALGAAGDAVSGAADAVSDVAASAAGAVGDAAGAVGDAADATVGAVGDAASAAAGAVGDAASAAAGAVGDAASSTVGAVGDAGRAAASGGGGLLKLLLPLLLIGLLAFGLWKVLGGKGEVPEVPKIGFEIPTIEGLPGELGTKAGGIFDTVNTTLTGITDEDSAKAALPKIGDLTGQIGGLATGLTAEQKGPLGTLISGTFMKPITDQIDRIKAIPVVGDLVGNALDGLLAKVKSLVP